MERVKKRKLKFPCISGGNDETRRRKSVQSCSHANPTTEQSLFKFEVGKSTSKQRSKNRMKKLLAKGISNGISAKKRSPGILAKLMGRGELTSKSFVLNPNTTDVKIVGHSSDECRMSSEFFSNVTECKCIDAIDTVPNISSQVKEGFESGHDGLYGYNYFGDENLHVLRSGPVTESEEITMASRIIFDQHDRLTHSLSQMSESSLIREATNRMLERWNMTRINEDVGIVSKVGVLGEMLSFPFPDKEIRPAESDNVTSLVDTFASPSGLGTILGDRGGDNQGDRHLISTSRSASLQPYSFNDPNHKRNVCPEDDAGDKVYSEPSNRCTRKMQKDVFIHEEDMPSNNVRSNKSRQSSQKTTGTYLENEDPAKYQPTSDIDVYMQLSRPDIEDVVFASDCFESISSHIQDLKRNLHLLTNGSTLVSNSPESAYTAHVLQTLESYATDPDTSSPSRKCETTHHPIDPRLFYLLEKYYFEGTVLSRKEKRLFYDYIEQMFVRASKSKVAYPWVNPVKRESQLRLVKLSLDDQIGNVVDEIEKDEDEDLFLIYYDKDLEWLQPTNEINSLGKLISELVLTDLLLEVVDL